VPTGGSHTPVEAIDRALLLLDELARAGAAGASLADLAQALGLNKSTAHRALSALRLRDYVAQDPASGLYQLGHAALTLGQTYFGSESLQLLLHPALLALSREAGELVHLGVLAGDRVLYVDKVEPERAIRVWSQVGQTVPLATTSLGRALLAYRDTQRAHLDAYLQVLPEGRVVDAEQVWETIASARRLGYATEFAENEPGIACVGIPVLRGGTAVGALSITAPAERMTTGRTHELVDIVRRVVPPLLPAGFRLPEALTAAGDNR